VPQRPATQALPRARNRASTEERIINAAIGILSDTGFIGLGINPIAQRAGIDKQLIYRYFGGMDGVIAALGKNLGLWLTDAVEAGDRQPPPGTYAELIARLLDAYIVGLRGSPLVQRLLAWELVQPGPALKALEAVRSEAVSNWMARVKGDLKAPEGIDAPAINALLLAGVHHLVLREASIGRFAGLDLADATGWSRVRAAAHSLIFLAYPTRVRRDRTGPATRHSAPPVRRKTSRR
jgi:AcrR family transcriptional regulator